VKFRELVRGFPWAWDEEVVAGVAHLPAHQSAQLAAACRVAEDAFAEVVLRRGVQDAVALERGPENAQDVKAVAAQDAAHREQREEELQARQGVPPQVPPAQPSLPEQAQLVSLRELPELEWELAEALQAQLVSPPRVPEHVVQREALVALGPLASRPQAGARVQPEEPQGHEPAQVRKDGAKLPSRPLPSPCARLPPRFPRPLRPSDGA
jgi:hypothetical protein